MSSRRAAKHACTTPGGGRIACCCNVSVRVDGLDRFVSHFVNRLDAKGRVSIPAPFRSVLKLERRVSHEGMVSVGGNLYSVPDATRKRVALAPGTRLGVIQALSTRAGGEVLSADAY